MIAPPFLLSLIVTVNCCSRFPLRLILLFQFTCDIFSIVYLECPCRSASFSFRQLQAVSQQLKLATGGRVANLDFFSTLPGMNLRPVAPGEVRISAVVDGGFRAAIQNPITKETLTVLPDNKNWFVNCPTLVFQLDQGSPGTSGFAFAVDSMGRLIHSRWDLFHRCVNDVKLGLKSAGPLYVSCQMHSTYLWALQFRPFSSGAFSYDLKRLHEHFFATEDMSYHPFQLQWRLFRTDLSLPDTAGPLEVWEAIANLEGFQRKGTLPKLSRWFSWNAAYSERAPEFRVLRMLLGHHLGPDAEKLDPNEALAKRELEAQAKAQGGAVNKESLRKEFAQMKESLGGGVRLAFHMMSDRMLQCIHLIGAATQPLWTWYAESVTSIKNAAESLELAIRMQTQWPTDEHLQLTAGLLMSGPAQLVMLVNDPELGKFKDTQPRFFDLCTHLLKQRAWSFAKQYSSPPDCYAAALSTDVVAAQEHSC